MKSYSDNIPNISTAEIKRSAEVTDETNGLVKNNLEEIKKLHEEVNTANKRIVVISKALGVNIFVAALTFISSVTLIILYAAGIH